MRSSLFCGTLALVVAAGVAEPSAISAQSAPGPTRPLLVGIGGGLTVPTGDFAQDANAGYNVGGFLQYRPGTNPFGIRGEVQYHRNEFSSEVLDDFNLSSGNTSILYIGAAGVLEFAPPDKDMGGFLIAGVGNYNRKVSAEGGSFGGSESLSDIGFSLGAGLAFKVSSAKLLIESRFHSVKIRDAHFNFIPITLSVVF